MDNSRQYGTQTRVALVCLGHPAHALLPDENVCRICGSLATGAQIGLYHVQRLLGTGRSGHAYLAVHQRSGQPAVLKLFPPDVVGPAQWDQWEAARREVRAVTALRHPAILPVFSCGPWNAGSRQVAGSSSPDLSAASYTRETFLLTICQYVPYTLPQFVAHYQRIENQRALLEQGLAPLTLVANLIQQIGSALSAAHARGIVHGALVPGNILLSSHERIWVADFGLARLHLPSSPYLPPELSNSRITGHGSGSGHSYWQMASFASDQYMLAVLCQQLLMQLLQPAEYERLLPVIQRATQSRPEQRYPSLDLFIQDLVALTRAAPTPFQAVRGGAPEKKTDPYHTPMAATPNPVTPIPSATSMSHTLSGPITPIPSTPPMAISPVDDWEKRGDKMFTMRDYEGALQAYHRALELNWGRAVLWLALGDTYFALERYKEALMAYEQAMYLNPNDPQVWANRGTVLDVLGRHQEALDCYERSEQLQP